jgi:hypothetical protein
VSDLVPGIPISKHDSLTDHGLLLRQEDIAKFLAEVLTENNSGSLLPKPFVETILARLDISQGPAKTNVSIKDVARKVLPKQVKVILRNKYKRTVDYYSLAFRVAVAFRANQIFMDDSAAFAN